jgi:hypothetical protein
VGNHFANARARPGHNSNFIVEFEHNCRQLDVAAR